MGHQHWPGFSDKFLRRRNLCLGCSLRGLPGPKKKLAALICPSGGRCHVLHQRKGWEVCPTYVLHSQRPENPGRWTCPFCAGKQGQSVGLSSSCSSDSYKLCALGQVMDLSKPQFLCLSNGQNNISPTSRVMPV